MKLNQLYTHILGYCGLVPNDDGEVDMMLPGEEKTTPATIAGRRLVLPTKEQLAKYHPEKVLIFHPLQEHIERGESEIVKHLRLQLNVRTNIAISMLAGGLLDIAGSRKLHAEFSPEQRELLKAVPNADAKSEAAFVSFVMKNMRGNEQSCISNIFLKRSGTYRGVKHTRIGVVAFPYYDLFKKESSLRVGDKEDFPGLMEYMFPGSSNDAEAYNSYSDSKDAPWLESLLKASYNVTGRMKELVELFGNFLKDDAKVDFDTEWVEALENIENFRDEIRRIPSQKGNEGTVTVAGEERSTVTEVAAPARAVPGRTEEPAPYRVSPPAAVQTPVYPNPAYQQPVPYVQAPLHQLQQIAPPPPGYVYAPAPAAAPPAPVTNNGKLDLRSLSAAVPGYAAGAAVATPLTDWGQQQVMRQMPQQYVDPRSGRVLAPTMRPQMQPVQQPVQIFQDAYGNLVDQYNRPVDQYGRPLQQPVGGGYISQI